ncbi:MAG: hypothetical protein H6647_06270 [Anaerolineales bacterium]|nr:hypothetical protein [Anaerolineales bacterium]
MGTNLSAEEASGRTAEQAANTQIAEAGDGLTYHTTSFDRWKTAIVVTVFQVLIRGVKFSLLPMTIYTHFLFALGAKCRWILRLEELYNGHKHLSLFATICASSLNNLKTYTNAGRLVSTYNTLELARGLADEVDGQASHSFERPRRRVELKWGTGFGGAIQKAINR